MTNTGAGLGVSFWVSATVRNISSTSEKVRMGRLPLSVRMGQSPSLAVGDRMVILPSTTAPTISCSRKYSIRIS